MKVLEAGMYTWINYNRLFSIEYHIEQKGEYLNA